MERYIWQTKTKKQKIFLKNYKNVKCKLLKNLTEIKMKTENDFYFKLKLKFCTLQCWDA